MRHAYSVLGIIFSSILPFQIAVAAPTPITFDVDPTRSSLTWDLKFVLGNLVVPISEATPGSGTSPIDGTFTGFFDPVANTVSVDVPSNAIFQPDTRVLTPSWPNLGLLSSIGGTIDVPGLLSGFASVRNANYGLRYFINSFRPDEIAVGTTVGTGIFNLATSYSASIDYDFTGVATLKGTYSSSLLYAPGDVIGTYTRLSSNTGEFVVRNLDRPVPLGVIQVGSIFIPGELRLKGDFVAQITFVPEVSPGILLSFGILPVVAWTLMMRRRQQ
ncbi:hypothetical protein K2X85_11335 [bacterium]|nr:hypothetical protein [bacterium]